MIGLIQFLLKDQSVNACILRTTPVVLISNNYHQQFSFIRSFSGHDKVIYISTETATNLMEFDGYPRNLDGEPSCSHHFPILYVPHIFLIKMAKTLKTPSFRHANSVQRGTDNISASLRLRRNSRCLNAEVSRLKIEMDRSYGSKYLSV